MCIDLWVWSVAWVRWPRTSLFVGFVVLWLMFWNSKSDPIFRLMQAIGGTGIKNKQRQKMAFKMMECINQFCESARAYGVPNEELFQTVDLYERQNLWQVVTCLQSLARKVSIIFSTYHLSVLPSVCIDLLTSLSVLLSVNQSGMSRILKKTS